MSKYDKIKFTAPDTVKSNYRRGLDKHEEGLSGDGLERQTVEVAKEIVAGEAISPEWARKGSRWWGRNERFLDEDEDSAAYVASLLWGGAAGRDWFASLVSQMDEADKESKSNSTMVNIVNRVNNAAIRRERNSRGDLCYVVPSFTMVFDSVLNGGFYSGEQIEASYMTLNDTPAPLGHPVNENGDFISASSPDGVIYYQCGAFNRNATVVESDEWGKRVYAEVVIHVETAMKTERGKRVLEAIDKGEPIHMSTGLFLNVTNLDSPQVNKFGDEYTWVAEDIICDHNAILLDEEGANTPEQGVGMMVNKHLLTNVQKDGREFAVNTVVANLDNSESDKRDSLNKAVMDEFSDDEQYAWVVDYDDDQLVFENKEGYYQIGYTISEDDEVSFVGELIEVKRKTMWQAIANWFGSICGNSSDQLQSNQYGHGGHILNALQEGNDMSFRQDYIDLLKANQETLKARGIEVNFEKVTDDELKTVVSDLLKANSQTATNEAEEQKPEPAVESNDKTLEAVNALSEQVKALETKLNAKEEDEMKAMRDYLKKNGDYEDGEVEDMGNKAVKAAYKRMKGNSQEVPAYHVGGQPNFTANSDDDALYGKMPSEEV